MFCRACQQFQLMGEAPSQLRFIFFTRLCEHLCRKVRRAKQSRWVNLVYFQGDLISISL
jgi:hypothetical protein